MATARIACPRCGQEFDVSEGEPTPKGLLEDAPLVVPEHDADGVRCGGSLIPGELRRPSE